MPELPEVETIARTLAPDVVGREIVRVEALDAAAPRPDGATLAAIVTGRRIEGVGRRAKLLLLRLAAREDDLGAILAAHLRMTGRFIVLAPGASTPNVRVLFHLSDATRLAFADVRRFGTLHAFPVGVPGRGIETWPFYAGLGPEPLDMTARDFQARLGGGRARVKARLLDQSVIAGVGNIYADESLFRAGIRPDTPVDAIGPAARDRLFAALVDVLRLAIAENGSSIRDYRDAHGDAGAFQNHFRAYGREGEPCLVCGAAMRTMRVAGRTSTFCPNCQPAPGGRGR